MPNHKYDPTDLSRLQIRHIQSSISYIMILFHMTKFHIRSPMDACVLAKFCLQAQSVHLLCFWLVWWCCLHCQCPTKTSDSFC